MSIIVSRLNDETSWEARVEGSSAITGNAESVLRFIANRMGVELPPLRVNKHYTGDNEFSDEAHDYVDHYTNHQSIGERQRLIAERNADGRHPIG